MANELTSVKCTINGTEYVLELATSGEYAGKWVKTGVAPNGSSSVLAGGYYPASITATYSTGLSTTVDNTTSGELGQACRLIVKEKVPPTITINSPTADSYITSLAQQRISVTIKDNASTQTTGYSGFNLDDENNFVCVLSKSGMPNITLKASSFNKTPIMDGSRICGYSLEFSPTEESKLTDGVYTISVTAKDVDGNSASASNTFTVDMTKPELIIDNPVEGFSTASDSISVTGTTTEETSNPLKVEIFLNDVKQGEVTPDSDGSFAYNIKFKAAGTQKITVTVTDKAGNSISATRNGYYSDAKPVFNSVRLIPNPADAGATFTIVVDVV